MNYTIEVTREDLLKLINKHYKKVYKKIKIKKPFKEIVYEYVINITQNNLAIISTFLRLLLFGNIFVWLPLNNNLILFISRIFAWLVSFYCNMSFFVLHEKDIEFDKNHDKYSELILDSVAKELIQSFLSNSKHKDFHFDKEVILEIKVKD